MGDDIGDGKKRRLSKTSQTNDRDSKRPLLEQSSQLNLEHLAHDVANFDVENFDVDDFLAGCPEFDFDSEFTTSHSIPAPTVDYAVSSGPDSSLDTSSSLGATDHNGHIDVAPDTSASGCTTPTPAAPCFDEQSSASSPSLPPNDEPFLPPEFDTCFGVILTTAKPSLKREPRSSSNIKVSVSKVNGGLKLRLVDGGTDAGRLGCPTLLCLVDAFSVKLDASLVFSREKKATTPGQQECQIRIVVFGRFEDREAVGELLGDAELFLQHPTSDDCPAHVSYHNPQLLLRPGAGMPSIASLSISSDASSRSAARPLDEVAVNRFMRVFDSADGRGLSVSKNPSHRLQTRLERHQLTALAMMSEKECGAIEGTAFPSLWETSKTSSTHFRHRITQRLTERPVAVRGGILADDMGLGKTLSVIALLCWSLDQLEAIGSDGELSSNPNTNSRSTLVVATKSTIYNWQSQIHRHVRPDCLSSLVYHGSSRKALATESLHSHDVVITTYDTLKSDYSSRGPIYAKAWHRVVLDEAHKICNRSSETFKAASDLRSEARWCLTGTPIQNSIEDYGALLAFVGIPSLSRQSEFDHWIARPIKDKHPTAIPRLRQLVQATCLRRTKATVKQTLDLPQCIHKTESLSLLPRDRKVYGFFQRQAASFANPTGKGGGALTLINILRLICNHGEDMLPRAATQAWEKHEDLRLEPSDTKICISCGCSLIQTSACSPASPEDHAEELCQECRGLEVSSRSHRGQISKPSSRSAKVEALIRNLRLQPSEDKSVVFSSWTKMLDLVHWTLDKEQIPFVRIDGQTSLEDRIAALNSFQSQQDCKVMLASVGSAGEGVNLTAANRVHLLEPLWNPMKEAQAVDRVHRLGQTKEVYVTRYTIKESIEDYVRWIQQDKLRLINLSLDAIENECSNNQMGPRETMLRTVLAGPS